MLPNILACTNRDLSYKGSANPSNLCVSQNIWLSDIFILFFNILKSKVLVHEVDPTA